MSKGYGIVQVDLRDPEKYKGYMAATVEPFRKYGARYLVRAEYQEARKVRLPVSTMDVVVIEGYEGQEPG